MNTAILIIICVVAGLLVGAGGYYFIARIIGAGIVKKAAEEAEVVKKNKIVEAKEKFIALKLEHDNAVREQDKRIQQQEQRLQQREQQLNQRQGEIQRSLNEANQKAQAAEQRQQALDYRQQEIEKMHHEAEKQLEQLSGMSAEEAKKQLVEALRDEAKTAAMSYINEIMDNARLEANKEAKKIIIQTIQRVASETAAESTVSVFHIENDEVKGRIIGREGRNIRALEAATGVEIVVDDTPEAITLSAFDPVRREIARLSLHQLVQDGRIHPARIEEVVAKVTKQVEETANLCAAMAGELGLSVKAAKRAGLLHDIGKVSDEDVELPHAELGMKLCEKYGEKPDICNAVGAHHDECEMKTLIAPIVQACDAISGARPGARREIVESYVKRLNDLENLAMSFPGVVKTYALQAGRELRVIVGADKISDKDTELLSFDLAKRIQDEMTYPGQVKVTVIREVRAVNVAK